MVDDDSSLLRLAEKYLTRLGYTVTTCRNAEEAWSRFQSQPEAHALALIDLSLRDPPGDELARRMIQSSATVKILLWSGYPYDPLNLGEAAAGRAAFLLKPFSPGMLAASIEKLLLRGKEASA